jgi:hypothetical protein
LLAAEMHRLREWIGKNYDILFDLLSSVPHPCPIRGEKESKEEG